MASVLFTRRAWTTGQWDTHTPLSRGASGFAGRAAQWERFSARPRELAVPPSVATATIPSMLR
jgi:hypothetical protein